MSDFTEKFFDNLLELCKYWMIGFGVLTYPLWIIKAISLSDWVTIGLMAFTPVMVAVFAFIMTFQRYKDQKKYSD